MSGVGGEAVPNPELDALEALIRPTTARHGGFGWLPDVPDARDRIMPIRSTPAVGLMSDSEPTPTPSSVDLTAGPGAKLWPPIYNQGQLGSCTGQAIAALYYYLASKQATRPANWSPSRLGIYYCERLMEGSTKQDAGAYIRDGFKVISKVGVGDESLYPHDLAKFTKQPGNRYWKEANNHQALTYMRVDQTEHAIRQCLADGFPVVIGISVYESFDTPQVAKDGLVPMPGPTEKLLGGHAVCVVGYDQAPNGVVYKVRNSWGTGWGQTGYFWLPAAYVHDSNLADDLWTARLVE